MRSIRSFVPVVAAAAIAFALVPEAGIALSEKVQEVLVTNTAAKPVPTQAVGTTEISGEVTIDNGASSPVPVEVQNAPTAPEPWQDVVRVTVFGGADNGQSSFILPAGRRFVIERIGFNSAQPIKSLVVEAACGGNVGPEVAVPLPADTTRGVDHLTLLHVPVGATGTCIEVRLLFPGPVGNPDSFNFFNVHLSGWAVPATA